MFNKIPSRFCLLFTSLFILTVPFPHHYIPDVAGYLHPLFEACVKWTGRNVLHIQHSYNSRLVSDSTGLYIHLLNLAVFSLLFSAAWLFLDRKKRNYDKLFYWFSIVVAYYLALMMLEYGFSKLFKWQFYLPEPNTLYTSMGNTPRDLMYWSTMGLSRPYTVFAGIIEIIAAVLLLFRRTRLAGALLSFVVLLNVVAINFCYDISVKILSSFLLLLSCIIIWPDARRFFYFLFGEKNTRPQKNTIDAPLQKQAWPYRLAKTFIICYMLFSSLWGYIADNNFNDDMTPRPPFHGAYRVIDFVRNGDTTLPILTDSSRWRRTFVHRRGYFITQDMNDEMQDYALTTDTINHIFFITREDDKALFRLDYKQYPGNILTLSGSLDGDSLAVKLEKIDMTNLPALQNEFNWTSDEFQ